MATKRHWSWLGHVLRYQEHSLVRRTLLACTGQRNIVKGSLFSLFFDTFTNIEEAINEASRDSNKNFNRRWNEMVQNSRQNRQ
jgi:hypothetical protein